MDGEILAQLTRRAEEVAGRAYVPYSGFHVGAALLTAAGDVYAGCNVENQSYGLTICAERSAVAAAVSAEGPAMRVAAIVVTHPGEEACSPCGACRQVLVELGAPDAVVRYRAAGGPVTRSLPDLLPDGFTLPS